jgi:hypothetical protein
MPFWTIFASSALTHMLHMMLKFNMWCVPWSCRMVPVIDYLASSGLGLNIQVS